MKTIKAFIAADVELAADRAAFAAMIDGVNEVLAARDVRVELQDYDPDRHGDVLDESEIALVVYHTRCGAFGSEQVDDAYNRIVAKRNPKRLYIFFKDDAGKTLDEEFVKFRASFVARFEHFFCQFENVDTLKLNFLLSVENLLAKDGDAALVSLDGTSVQVGGQSVGDIRSLPMIANNEGLGALFSQLDDLQGKFEAQKAKVAADPTSETEYEGLLDLSGQVNELQDRVDRELSLALGLAKRMSAVTIGETNEILARARSCMEAGKIKEAIAILDSADCAGSRERMLRRKRDEVDEARAEAREFFACVQLELFRARAISRYDALSEEERQERVSAIRAELLEELREYRENSSVQLTEQIDKAIAEVEALRADSLSGNEL